MHIGTARSFTLNKGSISYNHNMAETYRQGIQSCAHQTRSGPEASHSRL
jgi:hypothetical protein